MSKFFYFPIKKIDIGQEIPFAKVTSWFLLIIKLSIVIAAAIRNCGIS